AGRSRARRRASGPWKCPEFVVVATTVSGILYLNRRRHGYVVGRAVPAARVLGDVDARDAVAELRRDPDVIEPASAVGGLPIVHRPVAPPGVELFRLRRELAHRVDPVADLAKGGELL